MEQIETGCFTEAVDVPRAAKAIRIVSWNINRGLQLDGVIDFLRAAAADLILLQETDVNARRTKHRNIAREIAQALGMEYAFACEFEELTQGNHRSPAYHGQATLSRLPLGASRILRFRTQSDFWRPRWFIPAMHPFQRRLGGRLALINHVEMLERRLVLYNVHLESRGDDELRCRQLSEIFDDVRQCTSDMAVVIAGDFNFDLSQPPAATLVSNMQFANQFNHNCRRPTTDRSGLRGARAIDWILSSGPVAVTEPRLHDSIRTSDHYPLSLVVGWR